MKITIAYAGKTGTTQQSAAELAQLLTARGATVALCNLATQKPDLTADAFADDIQRCMEAGMQAHLAKPIHPSLMFEALRQQMSCRS